METEPTRWRLLGRTFFPAQAGVVPAVPAPHRLGGPPPPAPHTRGGPSPLRTGRGCLRGQGRRREAARLSGCGLLSGSVSHAQSEVVTSPHGRQGGRCARFPREKRLCLRPVRRPQVSDTLPPASPCPGIGAAGTVTTGPRPSCWLRAAL